MDTTDKICDFCTSSNATWLYPCESFKMAISEMDPDSDHASAGDWFACDICAALIEQNSRAVLGARALDAALVLHPEAKEHAVEIYRDVLTLHEQFFEHRTGSVRPLQMEVVS